MYTVNIVSMFWNKKKRTIRFYNPIEAIVRAYPVIHSKSLKRPWMDGEVKKYKNLLDMSTKSSTCPLRHIVSTAKCPGIHTLFNTGYIVRAPMDIKIITNGDGVSFHASTLGELPDNYKIVGEHPPEQLADLVAIPHQSLKSLIKIHTTWKVSCPDDIVFLVMPVSYNNESRFTTAMGILDPLEAPEVNSQLYWHVLDGAEVIKAGTALAQYIPIPRDIGCELIVDTYQPDDARKDANLAYALTHSNNRNHNVIKKMIND